MIGRVKHASIRTLARCCDALDPRRRLIVHTLHRMGPGHRISADCVRRDLEFFARRYKTVHPSDWPLANPPRRAAMITIDDGHHDVYDVLFPIARRLNLKFVICGSTDFLLRNRWLWFDLVTWGLNEANPRATARVEDLTIVGRNADSCSKLLRRLSHMPPAERDTTIRRVFDDLRVAPPDHPTPDHQPCSRAQIQEMLDSELLELSAHTVTHTIVTRLEKNQARAELADCKAELESLTGSTIRSFCYPNGQVGDFNNDTRAWLAELGFRLAFTSVPGVNHLADLDPLCLRRLHVHVDEHVLWKEASGLGDWQRKWLGSKP